MGMVVTALSILALGNQERVAHSGARAPAGAVPEQALVRPHANLAHLPEGLELEDVTGPASLEIEEIHESLGSASQ